MKKTINIQIMISHNIKGPLLQRTDFESKLLYKVYVYLINMELKNYVNIKTYFTNEEIKLLFNKAMECYSEMKKIYDSGSVLSSGYYNYLGDYIKLSEESTFRSIINKLAIHDNIYGKALALDTFFNNFSRKFSKEDADRTKEELELYIVLKSKETQLNTMNEMFGGIL